MFQFDWKNKGAWSQWPKPDTASKAPADKSVTHASALYWEEHCVECSAPNCYTSCGLYADRGDGNCGRFSYGIYPNKTVSGLLRCGADIRFKRWAKLEAVWPRMPVAYPLRKVRLLAAIMRIHGLVQWTARKFLIEDKLAFQRAQYVLRLAKDLAFGMFGRRTRGAESPGAFYIKLFSAEPVACALQLELVQEVPVYRNLLKVLPGWNEYTLPFGKFEADPDKGGYLRIWVDRDQEVRLIFTWLDLVKFVQERAPHQGQPAEKIKCVAWDLDNTLWKGVIGDDGKDGVMLVPKAVELIRALDQRGIVQTIASKNEHDLAWNKVVELGLGEYFLYPAINWNPKSANISQVAKELNINVNTFALIDDSEFERGEVSSALPQVRVYDPEFMESILKQPEFDVPVTPEAASRRLKYMEEISRKAVQQNWVGDLDGFLRDCSITLNIRTIRDPSQKDRCLELLHRSNQFHLSGKRYTPDEFDGLLADPQRECYALDVQDRYGDYGIVGFVSIRNAGRAIDLTDFVMSCRVAKKKVENAFFHYLLNREDCLGKEAFATMVVTGRNQPLRQVFEELMFQVAEEDESRILWQADADKIRNIVPPITINRLD